MSIRFRCPFCQKPLKLVNAEKMGQPMQCPNPVCKKWIVFNDKGMPQEQSAPPLPPPVGTRPQPQTGWLSVDGVDDDHQLKKVKRPSVAPASSPPRSRGSFYDRGRGDQNPSDSDEEVPDFPPALPGEYRNGDSEPPEPPKPPRMPSRGGAPPVPPPPRGASTRRPVVVATRSGSKKTFLIAILLLGLVGLGVAGYFVFVREKAPVFVKTAYGVIEISTTSIKAIIVKPFPDGESYNYEMVKDFDSLKVSSARLQEDGKAFDPRSLDKAIGFIQEFYDKFRGDPYNLPPERIAIVRSSGVVAGFKDVETLDANQKLLESRIREKTGLKLDPFTPQEEAKYIARFVIPQHHLADAMLIDAGGGNIKGGFFNADGFFFSTDADTGTTRFKEEVDRAVKAGEGDFQTVARKLSRPLVFDKLRTDIQNIPALQTKPKIYLCGGITWVLRTYTHPNDPVDQLIVELTHEDIEKLRRLVVDNPEEKIKEMILAEVQDENQRTALGKQIDFIKTKISLEEIRSGVEILTALSDAYEFPKKKLLYYSKGPVAPNMGYVLYQLGLVK